MLTKNELKQAKCAVPGCTGCAHDIFLHAICHPHAGLDVNYSKLNERLVIRCHRCAALVAEIAVGDGADGVVQ